MQVSQIFLTDDGGHSVPPVLQQFNETVQAGFPNLFYHRYNNEELRGFIKSKFDADVLEAFDHLRSYSNKADLGRYCLLYAIGGWYFDMGIRLNTPIEVGERIEMLAFREIQKFTGTCWACMTAVIYSKPGNPALRYAIEQIVANYKNKYYGITPLSPTATPVLGQALARHGEQVNFVYGDFLELTPTHEKKNTAFVLPDGTILAWGKPAGGGDLSSLGAQGTNNYNQLWHTKQIYGSPIH
jgi:mannosyltransferase OCH1-like enzyme